VPGPGVYAVTVDADGLDSPGACSIGSAGRPLLVRLPDRRTGPIPGDQLVLSFLDRLRPAPPGEHAPTRITAADIAGALRLVGGDSHRS